MRCRLFCALGCFLSFLFAGCAKQSVSLRSLPLYAEPQTGPGKQAPGAIAYRPQVLEQVIAALREKEIFQDEEIRPVYGYTLQRGLAAYQSLNRLPVTAEIDDETLAALGLAEPAPELLLGLTARKTRFRFPGAAPLVRLDAGRPADLIGQAGTAWQWTLDIAQAEAARLFFEQLRLKNGAALTAKDRNGRMAATYSESLPSGGWQREYAPLPLTLEVSARETDWGKVAISRARLRLFPDKASEAEILSRGRGRLDQTSSLGRFSPAQPAYQKGAAVAALLDKEGVFCSGILIGPNLLLTASHCVADQQECEQSVARFNYQEDQAGAPLVPADYQCRRLVRRNGDLGYGLLELEGRPGEDWGYARLNTQSLPPKADFLLIGHPGGLPKRIGLFADAALQTATAVRAGAAPEPLGSDGAPLLDMTNLQVVGLAPGSSWTAAHLPPVLGAEAILADCPECRPPLEVALTPFDLNQDGKADFFFRLPSGEAGILTNVRNVFQVTMLRDGWLSQWNLGDEYQALPADVDGDGRDDLMAVSPHWIAVFKGLQGQLSLHWMSHEKVGEWRFASGDRAYCGDFNGDGRDDLLLHNSSHLGMLLSNGNRFSKGFLVRGRAGDWQPEAGDRFWVGDFTGDGQDDLLVRNGRKISLLELRGSRLVPLWTANDWVGFWHLQADDQHATGDFNGDGRQDLIALNNRRLSLWLSTRSGFQVAWVKEDRIGQWALGWLDKPLVADFNGDGRDDLLLGNRVALAVLLSNGASFQAGWLESGQLGQWRFGPEDERRVGDFNGDGKKDVLVYTPRQLGLLVSDGTALHQELLVDRPVPFEGSGLVIQTRQEEGAPPGPERVERMFGKRTTKERQ